MKIAVTGASGFLGKHLVRGILARADEVVPVVRVPGPELPGSRRLEDVLANPSELDGVDALVHVAAVRHRHGVDESAYRDANVELVSRVMQAASGRVKRFVYTSSVGVYGFPHRLPIDETFPYAPVTTYSKSKVEAERLVQRRARELGLEVVIVRPTIIYGRGDNNGMLDKLARMIGQGRYLLVGDGSNLLHHTHVDDVVAGMVLACTVPAAAGEDFILAGPETISLKELSELVARTLGRPLPPVRVPLRFARLVATAVDAASHRGLAFQSAEPPINNEKLDVMTRSIAFDASKARRVLGYAPKVTYDVGIPEALGRKAEPHAAGGNGLHAHP